MNIDKRLDLQAERAKEKYDEFFTDPQSFAEDQEAFQQAYQAHSVAQWAVGKKLSSSYEVAKKIIDSI